MRTTKLKPVYGAKVRLLRDITTRGGQKFRAGLLMTIGGTDRGYWLTVSVRAQRHSVLLRKKDGPRYFEVVSVPQPDGGVS